MNADVHAVGDLVLSVTFLGSRDWWSILSRDDLAIGIHCDSIGRDLVVGHAGIAVSYSVLGLVQRLDFSSFATNRLEVVEVTLGDRGDIATTEDSDFEVLGFLLAVFAGDFSTGGFEVLQSLENHALGANVSGNAFRVTVVGNELLWRSQVNTIDMCVTV